VNFIIRHTKFVLHYFTNADFGGDLDDWRFTSDYVSSCG